MRHTITLRLAAIAIERRVTVTRVVSIFHEPRSDVRSSTSDFLSEFELHCDFNDHIDRRAVALGRREAPLAHGLHRALIEAGAETLHQPDVADRAVALHHDLEDDVAFEVTAAAFFRVVRLPFAHDRGGGNAAPGAIRAAAGTAARTGSDTGPLAFAEPGALAAPGAAAGAGPMAVAFLRRCGLRGDPRNAGAIPWV